MGAAVQQQQQPNLALLVATLWKIMTAGGSLVAARVERRTPARGPVLFFISSRSVYPSLCLSICLSVCFYPLFIIKRSASRDSATHVVGLGKVVTDLFGASFLDHAPVDDYTESPPRVGVPLLQLHQPPE
ncbi:hypothetical protein QBC41DRAFT_58674 [Cercophora samala]|uniref:Uncharacterized protein n=1 Tax=Cercophora samala TaxID=330535 RepID=A0AA39ZHW3_9PEZI|nr:hypothetical protein QBC41DRAFT_58674 [Cercophora samala]